MRQEEGSSVITLLPACWWPSLQWDSGFQEASGLPPVLSASEVSTPSRPLLHFCLLFSGLTRNQGRPCRSHTPVHFRMFTRPFHEPAQANCRCVARAFSRGS